MTTDAAIHARLSGRAELTALVGIRIFNTRVPVDTPAPYVRFQSLFGTPIVSHTDPAQMDLTYQVEAWAASPAQAKAIRKEVRAALDNQTLSTSQIAQLDATRDDYDDAVDLFRCDADFTVFEGLDD
jgi:hypothetical protein